MKKIISLFWCIFASSFIFAQAPALMDFQSIIRDSKGNVIPNQLIGVRISLLQGSVNGTSVYSETQNTTTNTGGLLTLTIGKGATTDNFSAVDWGKGPYFMKTEVDITGGTNYTLSSTTQMMSVPYALYAGSAGNAASVQKEIDEIKKTVVTDINLTIKHGVISLTQKDTAVADALPFHSPITWSSSKTAVATVDANGIVTPRSTGVATITAKSGTCSKSVNVYVNCRGVFSVSPLKQVTFAIGNLKINTYPSSTTGTLDASFCTSQTEVGSKISRGWTNSYGAKKDWPSYPFGSYSAGFWRYMNNDEWTYLISGRPNAAKLIGGATINGVAGVVLLPDEWVAPNKITFKPASTQTYTTAQWQMMESTGAVFLPISTCSYANFNSSSSSAVPTVTITNGAYWTSGSCNNGTNNMTCVALLPSNTGCSLSTSGYTYGNSSFMIRLSRNL